MAGSWLDTLLYGIRRIFFNGEEMPLRSGLNVIGGVSSVVDNPDLDATDIELSVGVGEITGSEPIYTTGPATSPFVNIRVSSGATPGSMSAANFTKLGTMTAGAAVASVSGTLPVVVTGALTPVVSVRSGEAATALYLVRRGSDGVARQITSDVGPVLTVGMHEQNDAAATLGVQQWSPAHQWTAAGYDVGAAGSGFHHCYVQYRTVQGAEAATGELHFLTQKNAGAVTSRFNISSTGLLSVPGAITVAGLATSNTALVVTSAAVEKVRVDATGLLGAAGLTGMRIGQTIAGSGAGAALTIGAQSGAVAGTNLFGDVVTVLGDPVSGETASAYWQSTPGTNIFRLRQTLSGLTLTPVAMGLSITSASSIGIEAATIAVLNGNQHVYAQVLGTNRIECDTTGVGFFNVAPVAQQADPTTVAALSDGTTGSPSGALVDVTTAALADAAKCNDNFARVAAHLVDQDASIHAIRTALRNLGLCS